VNIITWFWGSDQGVQSELGLEEFLDECVVLEDPEAIKEVEEVLDEKELDEEEPTGKELVERVGFFERPYSRQIFRILRAFPKIVFRQGMNPYDCAVIAEVDSDRSRIVRTRYFPKAKLLATRGSQEGIEDVTLVSGRVVRCSSQALRDITRWGKDSFLVLDGELISLELTPEHVSMSVGVSRHKKLPVRSVNIVDDIDRMVGRKMSQFELIMRYFNQGPVNDMVYDMMSDCAVRWGATLAPERKKKSAFHFTCESEDGQTVVKKVLITVQGFFGAGAVPYDSHEYMLERERGVHLGFYSGATAINLENSTAYVRTHVEVYPDVWEAQIRKQYPR